MKVRFGESSLDVNARLKWLKGHSSIREDKEMDL
jgi:hypothetical protein